MKKITLIIVAMLAIAVASVQAQTKQQAPPPHDNAHHADPSSTGPSAEEMKAHEDMEKKRHEGMETIMKEREAAMQKMEKGELTQEEFGKIEEKLHERERKLHEPQGGPGEHPAPAPHDHSDPDHKH